MSTYALPLPATETMQTGLSFISLVDMMLSSASSSKKKLWGREAVK